MARKWFGTDGVRGIVGDAITVRARQAEQPFRLVRVIPVEPGRRLLAGPYCCAPTRAGFAVQFLSWQLTAADESLH